MKVLLICYDIDPNKGGESAVGWNIAEGLSKFHDVTVITRPNNIKLSKLQSDQKKLNIIYLGFDLPLMFTWLKAKVPGGIFIYSVLWQYYLAANLKRKTLDFDIVHSVNFVSDTIPSYIYKLNTKKVWGPISHHEPLPFELSPLTSYLLSHLKLSLRKLVWILFNTRNKVKQFDLVLYSNKSVYKRLGKGKNTIFWPSTGVSSLENRKKFCKHNSPVVNVVYAGRMISLKGWLTICKIIEKISKRDQIAKVHFDLIGDGPLYAKIERRLKKLDTHSQVTWSLYGRLNHNDYVSVMEKSHIYACPSFEGGGIAVAEAMSKGLPIICFDNYGPGETVGKHYPGLVKRNSYGKFSEYDFYTALTSAIENPIFRQLLSQQSLKRVDESLNWDRKVKKLSLMYNSLLNQKN